LSNPIISCCKRSATPANLAVILVNALGGGVTMGAFCVFGISRTVCKTLAARKTPEREGREPVPIAVWAARRDALAEQLFIDSTRRVKISPELDAPQFCRDWLQADPGNVRDTVLMVRGPKVDKHGNAVTRNGIQVETWLNYEGECARLKITPYLFAEAS
jgi:hypothetical protein